MVVGVAGCPWVRESMAASLYLSAKTFRESTSVLALGSQTSVTASRIVIAYERLLISSLVQAKWVSSRRSSRPNFKTRSRIKYSTALTSCLVLASVSANSATSASLKLVTILFNWSCNTASTGAFVPSKFLFARNISHSISTSMRALFNPASLRC